MSILKEKADKYYKDREWNKALSLYKEIIDVPIYVKLAITQRFIKKHKDSEATLKKGLEKFPDNISLLIENAALENVRDNCYKVC